MRPLGRKKHARDLLPRSSRWPAFPERTQFGNLAAFSPPLTLARRHAEEAAHDMDRVSDYILMSHRSTVISSLEVAGQNRLKVLRRFSLVPNS